MDDLGAAVGVLGGGSEEEVRRGLAGLREEVMGRIGEVGERWGAGQREWAGQADRLRQVGGCGDGVVIG